jgi:hypothetical protein
MLPDEMPGNPEKDRRYDHYILDRSYDHNILDGKDLGQKHWWYEYMESKKDRRWGPTADKNIIAKEKDRKPRRARRDADKITVVGVGLVELSEAAPGIEATYATVLLTQDGRLVTLPTKSAYNMFRATGKYSVPALKKYATLVADNAETLRIAGITAGAAGNILTFYSIGSDYINYRNGSISGETLTVNTLSTGVGVVVAASVSGVAGPLLGITAGMTVDLTYQGIKAIHTGVWNWINYRFNPTNWDSYFNLGF